MPDTFIYLLTYPLIFYFQVNGSSPTSGYPPSHNKNGYYHMNASQYNPHHNPQHHQQQRQFCQSTPEAPPYIDDVRVPVAPSGICSSSSSSSSSCSRQSQIKLEMDSPGFDSTPLQHPVENGEWTQRCLVGHNGVWFDEDARFAHAELSMLPAVMPSFESVHMPLSVCMSVNQSVIFLRISRFYRCIVY